MATITSISRGNLKRKIEKGFAQAELFWEPRTTDIDNKSTQFNKWNEGTLWIGRPSLNGSPSSELPIPIAGSRVNNALVYRGTLSHEASILDKVFEHSRIGDWYIFSTDAVAGNEIGIEYTFHVTDDFRKDDVLVITDIGGNDNIDIDTGIIKNQSLIRYYRLNNSGGYADDVYFRESVTKNFYQWQANNVEGALKEVQIEKLQYVGIINSFASIPSIPVIGGVYLVTEDTITFNQDNENRKFICDKGDFVYYTADKLYVDDTIEYKKYNEDYYWHRIPSGYTNADEIDYYDNDRIANGQKEIFIKSLFSTFSEYHKSNFNQNSSTVHQMLNFLMGHKAQLDEQGKIPLSQLHDTVLGALQFRGNWCPLNGTIDASNMQFEEGTNTVTISEKERYNPLPGFANYSDGDTLNQNNENKPNNGDYYIIDLSKYKITNLVYDTGTGIWELNTGDWIVFVNSEVQDSTSPGSSNSTGYWTKIDNSDRLSQLSFIIDRTYNDNFFTIALSEKQLNLVGNPILRASHKIGLVNKGNNTVEIVGDALINQYQKEKSIKFYHPRYINEEATLQNSFIEDVLTDYPIDNFDYDSNQFHKIQTRNKTVFHGNIEVGVENLERRDITTYGDVKIVPHIELKVDTNIIEKSALNFKVFQGGQERNVYVYAQDGSQKDNYGIDEDVSDIRVNIMLPESTSTLVGKLAGIEFEETRILKSVREGYAETSSIEEHINDPLNDSNHHDSISNIVEFHSQISTPITNTFEIFFGSHDNTNNKNYNNDNFEDNGQLKSALLARLTKNFYQEESNIYVSLPCLSGTLLTQEDLAKIFNSDNASQTYLTMYGNPKTLDKKGNVFNTLQKAPLRQVENALRTKLLSSLVVDKTRVIRDATVNEFAKLKREKNDPKFTDTFNPTTDISVSDTIIENDVIIGKFDDTGNLIEKKTIVATHALGISDNEHSVGLFRAPRTNFSTAPQYYNPYTGEYNDVQDVQIDLPNESGVMLTNNSVIDGGLYI